MQLIARMHAWNDGRSFDVNVGTYEDERAAQEAALRFRKRFVDSIDAMMLFKDEKELAYGEEARTHG